MSSFEKIYQIDPSREKQVSIELSDKEWIEIRNKPSLIPMKLEMPILEEVIRKGKKNEKSTSESIKEKPKKVHKKSKPTTMARIQKKL